MRLLTPGSLPGVRHADVTFASNQVRIRLPKDPLKALECQLDSPACPVDIGQVNDRYFLNIAGTGFDERYGQGG